MDPLGKLHTLLSSYLEGVDIDVQTLHYELVAAKTLLRSLFDLPPRNATEKNELQSGECSTDGLQRCLTLET
jgi:hypothetical protein